MSYGAGFKRPRPDEFPGGYDRGIPYGPPGDFGPPIGAGPGHSMEPTLPAMGVGMGLGGGLGVGLGSGPGGQMPVVKLRGLPFSCDEEEVKLFLEVDTVDVVFVKRMGRFSGEAFVVLPGMMQVDFALGKHKAYMGKRYVEVQPALKEKLAQDYYRAVAAAVSETGIQGAVASRRALTDRPSSFGAHGIANGAGSPSMPLRLPLNDASIPEFPRGGPAGALDRLPPPPVPHIGGRETCILRLRGLPFSASREEIAAWFNSSGALNRPINEHSVHLVLAYDGRPTGSAFVEFISPQEAQCAMMRDKAMMGNRYVELFPSSRDEVSHATAGAY